MLGSSPAGDCLSAAQVETVRRAYAGIRMRDGRYAAMPLMRGGESDWVARMIGTPQQPRGGNAVLGAPFMANIVKADPKYDIMTFDPDRDWAELDGGIAAAEVHQQNPNIAPFVAGGGKLLLWHGFNDPGPSPLSTIAYYDAVKRVRAAKNSTRLFLAGRAALQRRRRARPIRLADGDRKLGGAWHRADGDDRHEAKLAVVAPAVPVSAAAALQRCGRHERRRELRVRGAVGAAESDLSPGPCSG